MTKQSFEQMLTGGHPNSLGRTVEVFEIILKDKNKLEELYNCYFSQDEIVRLRVSSVFKRISKTQPEWLIPYIDKFLDVISKINQASTQWTLAILFMNLEKYLTKEQKNKATQILKNNLEHHNDWIVLNFTMETLFNWSKEDAKLRAWIEPHLQRLSKEKRKSVANRAKKYLSQL